MRSDAGHAPGRRRAISRTGVFLPAAIIARRDFSAPEFIARLLISIMRGRAEMDGILKSPDLSPARPLIDAGERVFNARCGGEDGLLY